MRPSTIQFTKHPAFHLLLMAIVLLGFGWTIITPLVFFSSDIGLRFLQIRMLISQQWQSLAIPYPTGIDPHFEYVPYYYAYSLIDGQIFFNISPFYPYLASLLYAGLGLAGLVLSPIIGTLLTVWGAYVLAQTSQLPRPLLVMWATVFATPIFFYSLQLWDHSLGTGLAILGTALIAQGMRTQQGWRTAAGGLLLGWATGQRPEMYVFLLAVGLSWLLTNFRRLRQILPLLGGGFIGVVPIWLLQWRWVGHPLGMVIGPQLFGYGRPEFYPVEAYIRNTIPPATKMGRLLFHINSGDPLTFGAALLTVTGLVLMVFAVRVPRYQKPTVLWAGTALTFLGYAIWIVAAWQELVGGLVSTCALLAFSVMIVDKSQKNEPGYRIVLMTAFIFVTAMLLVWPTFGGLQWGARYLLPAYPLIVYLSAYAVEHHSRELKRPLGVNLQFVFICLLLVSITLQLVGLRPLFAVIDERTPVRDRFVNTSAEAIITNEIFTPWFTSGIEDKLLFYVDDEAELRSLITNLFTNDVRTITLLRAENGQISMPERIDDIIIIPVASDLLRLEKLE